ncbi:MAG: hypothetical protein J6I73_01615 [Treponema sp.]|nr:hypothetical protein [Treponema sp.]
MKKVLFVPVIFMLVLSFGNAQVSVDPNNDFYEAALCWHIRGIVDELPQLKPYPLRMIKKIIAIVIERGTEDDIAEAKAYYQKIFNKAWSVSLKVNERNLFQINDTTKELSSIVQLKTAVQGYGDKLFGDAFALGYRAGASFTFFELSRDVLGDTWAAPEYDTFVKRIGTSAANIDFNANAVVSYAWDTVSIAVGYNRTAFSSFVSGDNALNSSARNAPQCTFMFNGRWFNFAQYFAALEAADMHGEGSHFGKFLSLQTIRFALGRKVRLSLYDAVIYGKRFDPSYFIPVPSLLIAAANGHNDNVLAGFIFDWNIVRGISWITNMNVDHLDIPQLARFHINSDNRIALKSGFIYAPSNSLCKFISIDYTLISPYTYAATYDKTNTDTYNFFSYANGGRSIGSLIPPNSDCVELKIKLEPIANLTISTFASIARHANAYESLSDENAEKLFELNKEGTQYSSDGSINTLFFNSAPFLWGAHIMYICRGGIECSYEFPRTKAGRFSLEMNFVYTYVNNAGVSKPIYGQSSASDHRNAYDNWVANLHDEYDVYLSFGLMYAY